MRILVLCLLTTLLWSCQKESFTTDAAVRLTVVTDTLHFDTVFTRTGSTTGSFKIFNENSRGIRIQTIRLGGGAASPFKINVNGEPGAAIQNVELPAGDSAYVFVSVNIDPNAAQQPFLVQDSVEITYNGNREVVQLQAFGRNARFVRRRTITAHEVWTSELPYVVVEGIDVAAGASLTIGKGTQIYVHATAPISIEGKLIIKGGADSADRVRFQGSRLDEPYRLHPGAWPGIHFKAGSVGSNIQYTVFQNAYQALVLESNGANAPAELDISESIIDGAADAGMFSQGGTINAQNLLVSNCGKNLVLAGGQYLFEHCTIAGYSNRYLLRKEPLVQAGNTSMHNGGQVTAPLDLVFRNCIIWGSAQDVPSEVALMPTAGIGFSAFFDHVLWKMAAVPAQATVNTVIEEDPQFRSTEINNFDFRLQPTSPAVNKGKSSMIHVDLDGRKRPVGAPDLGAFEEQ